MNNENKKQDDDGGPLGQWLRSNKPPKPHFISDMDAFVEGVNSKLESTRKSRALRLKRNVLGGSALMCVVLLSFAFFDMSDVGSAGFKMIEISASKDLGRVYKNEFTGSGFNVLGDDTYEEIQEQAMQIEAGEGVVVGASGWFFEGDYHWVVTSEYFIGGAKREMTSSSKKPKSKLTKSFYAFVIEEWSDLENKINHGALKSTGHEMIKEIDGVIFSFSSWVIERPDGQVVFYRGKPVPKRSIR